MEWFDVTALKLIYGGVVDGWVGYADSTLNLSFARDTGSQQHAGPEQTNAWGTIKGMQHHFSFRYKYIYLNSTHLISVTRRSRSDVR